jgi:recombinational DNA repair protein (RecF pathway)
MKKSKIIKFLVPMAGLVSLVAVPASLVTSCADKKPTITINIGDYVYHGYTDPEFIQKINDASTGGIKISLDEIASYSIFTVNESLLTLTNGTKINLVHDFTNFIHDS